MSDTINKKKIDKKEIRRCKIELRSSETNSEKRLIVGTPIVYNKRSTDLGFFEINKPGSAANALKKSDVRALYGHNSDSLLPLGRQSVKTLRLKDTPKGVDIEIDPPDTSFARDLMISMERGDVSEMSYAFTVKDDTWERKDGADYRTINEIDEIFDVSIVTYPAFPDTTVALRSLDSFNKEISGDTPENIGLTAEEQEKQKQDENRNITINTLLIESEIKLN